jgi:hypothetical protein
VRVKKGKRRVQDGPFADTEEQLGNSLRSTWHSIWERAAQQPRWVLWRCVPLHLNPKRLDHRMSGTGQEGTNRTMERVARESSVVWWHICPRHARRGQREGRSQRRIGSRTRGWPRDGVPQNPEAWPLSTAIPLSILCVIRKWP